MAERILCISAEEAKKIEQLAHGEEGPAAERTGNGAAAQIGVQMEAVATAEARRSIPAAAEFGGLRRRHSVSSARAAYGATW